MPERVRLLNVLFNFPQILTIAKYSQICNEYIYIYFYWYAYKWYIFITNLHNDCKLSAVLKAIITEEILFALWDSNIFFIVCIYNYAIQDWHAAQLKHFFFIALLTLAVFQSEPRLKKAIFFTRAITNIWQNTTFLMRAITNTLQKATFVTRAINNTWQKATFYQSNH